MPLELQLILPYVMIAVCAGLVGGIIAFFWAPGLYARSALQHFAAGVVIAAVASDLIPEVEQIGIELRPTWVADIPPTQLAEAGVPTEWHPYNRCGNHTEVGIL